MNTKILTLILGILLVLPLITSAPPVTTVAQFTEGYVIEDTPQRYLKQNQDFQYNFFVYYIANGTTVTNATTKCYLFISDNYGEVIHSTEVPFFTADNHWGVDIMGGNFSRIGSYFYGTRCQDGGLGGPIVGEWEVNPDGQEFTTTKLLIYALSLMFMVMMILALLFIINKLPDSNAMDEQGNIMQISWLKYLRPVIWIIIYGISLAILFLLSNMALSYLITPMLGNILFVFYRIAFYFMIVALPVYVMWIFARIFQDKEMKRLIERGVDIKGTP